MFVFRKLIGEIANRIVPGLTRDVGNNRGMTTLPVSPMTLLHSTDGALHLWSRHGTPCTRQFPEFQSLRLPRSVILDGELIVVSSGWTDFDAVMERFMSRGQDKIVRLSSTTPAHFVAFDILSINGDSVMS